MPPRSDFRGRSTLTLFVMASVTACSGGDLASAQNESSADERTWAAHVPPPLSMPDDWALAGAGGTPDGGGTPDAAGSPDDGATSCTTPYVFFPDDDGDGWGRTADGVRACDPPPGRWSRAGGDCADFEPRANPAQRIYFPEPYTNANEEPTFDYDCNGYEDSDPRQPGGAPFCNVLSIDQCGGTGYIATDRASGEGINVLCGSRSMFTCRPNMLGLLCGPDHQIVDAALRCH